MELFQLLGTIAIDNDKANKALDQTTGKADSSQSKMGSAFKKIGAAVAAGFAVDKIVGFGKGCVEAAAEVKATNSQFEQVFGNLSGTANTNLNKIASDTGILATRMKGSYTQIAAFAKTTGMDTADSLSLSNRAMVAVADSAAYYDRSLESTTESLQSFLKGNFENDAALGLSCTETTRNAAANKLYGTSFVKLSESQKQLTLLKMVEDANKLSGAMGQAARESDGWENVIGNLKESFKQFQAIVGKPILNAVVPIVQKLASGMTGLGDKVKSTQKWFKEHSDTIKSFAKFVAVAATSVVAFAGALKLMAVISTITTSIRASQTALTVWTVATEGQTIAQGILNSELTLGQVAVGLFTGQVTLAELATGIFAKAQAALNVVMAANPIVLVCAALAALVIGYAAVTAATGGFKQKQSEVDKELAEANKHLTDYNKKMSDMAKTRNKTISDGAGEMNYYQGLAGELDTLVDKNGKVKSGYEERAKFITTTLNDALGTEIKMNGNVISGYDGVKKSIEKVIAQKKAKIMLDAYEAEYSEAIKQQAKLIEDVAKAKAAETEAQKKYNDYLAAGGSKADAYYSELESNVKKAEQAHTKAANTVISNSNKISDYEKMSADVVNGKTDSVIAHQGKLGDSYVDLTKTSRSELEKQKSTVQRNLDAANEIYKKTGDKNVKAQIDSYNKQLKEVKKGLSQQSSTIRNDGRVPDATRAMMNAAKKTASSVNWSSLGSNAVSGVVQGILNNLDSIRAAGQKMGNIAEAAYKKAIDSHSPSKVFMKISEYIPAGIVKGIENKEGDVIDSITGLSNDMVDAYNVDTSTTLGYAAKKTTSTNESKVDKLVNLMQTLVDNASTGSQIILDGRVVGRELKQYVR